MDLKPGARIEVCDKQQMAQIIEDMWDDRVSFAKYIIGFTPSDQQGDALSGLDVHEAVSVKSGHGCGKSGVESVSILQYMSCREFPKVVCTSPSKHQLYDVLWAELSKWHRQMNPLFREMFVWTKEKFMHKEHSEEWFAVARTATKENPEALAGVHADYVLKIIDEASGVPESVFEVLEGAHGVLETKELMCANPTRLEGTFYRSHTKDKASYHTLTWSCIDSPWVKQQYIDRIFRKFGKDSNIARVRVFGLFPLQEGDSFIPYALVEDALFRDIVPQGNQPVVFGVDVARFGDDETVIAIRRGDEFLPYHVLRGKDTVQVASYVRALANVYKPTSIFVDVIGWGAGVHDNLLHAGFPSYGINVSESPAMEPDVYNKLRDELWGHMRDWLQERRGKLCNSFCDSLKAAPQADPDDVLIGELTTPKYGIPHGKIVIESKDKLKARQVQSPNRADAHNLCFAQPLAAYRIDDSYIEGDEDHYQALDDEAGY